MSRNHKNNHYHYAEKFEDRRRRSSKMSVAFMPFKSVIISLVVLLMFGLVSTTFATYVSEERPEANPEAHPIISEIRNLKASRDISYTGASGDWASTGGNISGGTIYVEIPSTWSTSHVQFFLYQNNYCWCSDDMTHITGTRIWYGSAPDHSSWNAEQIMFSAHSSHADSGNNWNGNTTDYYSAKLKQSMTSGKHYFFTVSGSSNPYTNTATRTDKNSAKAAVGVYDQTAHVRTKSTAANGYEHSGTGGNVTVTASWLNLENGNHKADQGTTPSSDGGTSQTYSEAMWHTPVTFNATANTGYRFVGWFESESATTAKSISTSYTLTNSLTGTNELYARFIKRVTVTASKSPSGYSGTAPTVDGSSSSKTVDIGESVALDAHTTTGITAVWKNGSTTVLSSSTGNYTPTDSVTLTANYTLTAPTFTSYSYTTPITVGNTSNITKTVSSATGSNTGLSYTYTAAAVNSTASDAAAVSSVSDSANVFDSSGNFTPTVPGEYKITVSVKDTAKGLTSASVSKNTVIVKVRPEAPTGIAYDVLNKDSGTGLKTDPYMVPVNSTNFTIRSYIPVEDRDAHCTYNWTRTDGIYNTATSAVTSLGHSVTTSNNTEVTDVSSSTATDVIHNVVRGNQNEIYYYKVSVTAQRNGVESLPYSLYDDPTEPRFYYSVTNNFLVVEEFDFRQFNDNENEKVQKVYSEDNNINYIHAKYKAGGNSFNTMLWYSTNNIDYQKVAVWAPNTFTISDGLTFAGTHSALPDDGAHTVSSLITSLDTVARNNVNLMSVTGTKWFKGYVGDENGNSRYPELHTTVGTSSTVSNRPIYYVDATANQSYTADCRVMAFYTQGDETIVHYQTAQKVIGRENTYRFYIPSSAVKVTFAHVSKNNYVLPVYNSEGGNLSYSYGSDVLKAWTPTLDLTSSDNYGMTTYKADTPGTPSDGVYNYTNVANGGDMTTLD